MYKIVLHVFRCPRVWYIDQTNLKKNLFTLVGIILSIFTSGSFNDLDL